MKKTLIEVGEDSSISVIITDKKTFKSFLNRFKYDCVEAHRIRNDCYWCQTKTSVFIYILE